MRGVQWGGLVLVVALLLTLMPVPALAEVVDSTAPGAVVIQSTEHFQFALQLTTSDADAFVATYGPLAERSLDELTAIFAVKPAAPVQIIGYAQPATFAAAVTAIGRFEPSGTAAVADPGQNTIALDLTAFRNLSPVAAESALRHALAHILVGIAANGNAPRGFDEGIAEYVEEPVTPRLARIAALVQTASQQGNLISWAELNRPQLPSDSPDLIAAESYAVTAFLIDRYGLRSFRDYLKSLHNQPDWRLAMRDVYNRGSDEIEQQWRDNLAQWANGGWQDNAVAAFDLQPARDYLAQADYAAAKALLDRSQRLFTDLGDQDRLADVNRLLAECDTGIQAEALMTQTQQALESHTYDRAAALLAQAQAQYGQLPSDQRPTDLIATYGHLAQSGITATQQLSDASAHAGRWGDYRQARAAALAAGTTFAHLGDADMTQRAQTLLHDLDTRQRRLVYLLGALASLTVGWLLLWLWARGPSDLDWK